MPAGAARGGAQLPYAASESNEGELVGYQLSR